MWVCFVFSLALCLAAQAAPKALRFGTVITGQGGVIRNGVVVVDSDQIGSVGTTIPAGRRGS